MDEMRVLIIEDDPDQMATVCGGVDLFFQQSGIRGKIIPATDFQVGIRVINENDFDIALVDGFIPGGGHGLELISAIRQKHGKNDYPIVFYISSFAKGKKAEEALLIGANFCFPKPFLPSQLAQELAETLARLASLNSFVM